MVWIIRETMQLNQRPNGHSNVWNKTIQIIGQRKFWQRIFLENGAWTASRLEWTQENDEYSWMVVVLWTMWTVRSAGTATAVRDGKSHFCTKPFPCWSWSRTVPLSKNHAIRLPKRFESWLSRNSNKHHFHYESLALAVWRIIFGPYLWRKEIYGS